MAEETVTTTAEETTDTGSQSAAPKFKIGTSGTHATQGNSVTLDNPPPPASTAETATPEQDEEAPNKSGSAAEPGTGEPPKTRSAKFGATPQADSNEPSPATPPADATTPPNMEEVLKAQGFDENFIKLAKVYKEEGNISRYVTAMSTDFGKMPSEEIHRLNIQREYPNATPEQLELLYESEVKDRFKLDPEKYDPEGIDSKAARVKMEMEAQKLRDKFTQDNEALKLPTRDTQAEIQQQQQAATQRAQAAVDELLGHDFSKSVLTDKKIVLKGLSIKDESGKVTSEIPDFTMELEDPEIIKGVITEPGKLAQFTKGADGKPDPEVLWQMGLFVTNRQAYNQALINYGKMLGKEELVENAYNAPRSTGTQGTPGKESLNEAFANRGKSGKNGG